MLQTKKTCSAKNGRSSANKQRSLRINCIMVLRHQSNSSPRLRKYASEASENIAFLWKKPKLHAFKGVTTTPLMLFAQTGRMKGKGLIFHTQFGCWWHRWLFCVCAVKLWLEPPRGASDIFSRMSVFPSSESIAVQLQSSDGPAPHLIEMELKSVLPRLPTS